MTTRVHLGLLGCLLLASCAAEDGEQASESNDESAPLADDSAGKGAAVEAQATESALELATIRDLVKDLGFDDTNLEVEGNVVRVEDDITLYRDELFAGSYDPVVRVEDDVIDEQVGLIQKGYKIDTGIISAANRGSIGLKMAFYPTNFVVPQNVREFWGYIGLFNIFGWGQLSNTSLRIYGDETATTNKITVNVVHPQTWPANTTCRAEAIACADFPISGKPGRNVYVKMDYSAYCADKGGWSGEAAMRVAAHEIGHTLGLAHPKSSGSTLITGTQACTRSVWECGFNPNYTTVMAGGSDACGVPTVYQTTTDDQNSIRKLYPL